MKISVSAFIVLTFTIVVLVVTMIVGVAIVMTAMHVKLARKTKMHKSICYQTRNRMNGNIVTGGSFGGEFDLDTVNRLVRYHKYTVVVKPSGSPVFVDRDGREVNIYFFVDPRSTDAGKAALDEHRETQLVAQMREEAKERRVNELIANMSTDELLERLS